MTQDQKHTHMSLLYAAARNKSCEGFAELPDRYMEITEMVGSLYVASKTDEDFYLYCSPAWEQICSGDTFPENDVINISFSLVDTEGCEVDASLVPMTLTYDLDTDVATYTAKVLEYLNK